jgi:hypothetical protein
MIPSLNHSRWYHATSQRQRLLMLLLLSPAPRAGLTTPPNLLPLPRQLATATMDSTRSLTAAVVGHVEDRKAKDEADIGDEEDHAVTIVVGAVHEDVAVETSVVALVGISAVAPEALRGVEMHSRSNSNA